MRTSSVKRFTARSISILSYLLSHLTPCVRIHRGCECCMGLFSGFVPSPGSIPARGENAMVSAESGTDIHTAPCQPLQNNLHSSSQLAYILFNTPYFLHQSDHQCKSTNVRAWTTPLQVSTFRHVKPSKPNRDHPGIRETGKSPYQLCMCVRILIYCRGEHNLSHDVHLRNNSRAPRILHPVISTRNRQ